MPVKHSTACMHRSRNHAGLLPLRMRETPAREAARAYRIEAREQTPYQRRNKDRYRAARITQHASIERQIVKWFPVPPRVRGPHLHLNTSGQRRVKRETERYCALLRSWNEWEVELLEEDAQ